MHFSGSIRSFALPRLVLLALAALLLPALPLLAAPSAAAPSGPAATAESAQPTVAERQRRTPRFRVATLNLKNTMGRAAVAADVRRVIDRGGASVIGFQERGGSRAAMRAALPRHWALRMPRSRSGTDLNPIAFDKRVWRARNSWPALLAEDTWRRHSGRVAIDQYAVVAQLEHRRSGHLIRAASFHMPSEIHNRRSGGPNWRREQRVEAFWRMARHVRRLARRTPDRAQFVAMCDCNVKASRDRSDKLLRGKITRPLRLESNYSAAGADNSWQVDYVMGERLADFRIVASRSITDLRTDHPAVIAKFRKRR